MDKKLLLCFAVAIFSGCSDPRPVAIEHIPLQLNIQPSSDSLFFLPEDLEITLWAESPQLFNPTNLDVDARGRLWVTEAVNYRDFNNSPENHLHFGEGDRVMILEDTNGDGKCDLSKVFVQDKDLVAPLGIAVIGNQVIVSCSPNLIIYTDEDGDDKPDKKEIFLKGFGGYDHDHSLHAVVVGPDGHWYFNTGNAGPHTVTDRSGWTLRSGSNYTGGTPYNLENSGGRVSDDGRVWVGGMALRMNPDGTGLKVMAHNFRNAYELAPDSYGNIWQNDNDDQVVTCRVTWLMEGGNAGYFSADGTRSWQADQKPGQDIFSAHWHQEDPGVIPAGDRTGAGSPTGFAVYEGDVLGEKYRGMLLSVDAGRNVVFAYKPQPFGAGFKLERHDLITTIGGSTEDYKWNEIFQDKRRWFRPSDIVTGTDGTLYLADWYDPVVGGHQMHDSSGYGRIFRISPKGKKPTPPVFDLTTVAGQIEMLKNPAVNVRNKGFVQLQKQGKTVIPDVQNLLNDPNPFYRARAIWLLAQLGPEGQKVVEEILQKGKNPEERVTAYRALREANPADLLTYAEIAATDPWPGVRREVAVSLRTLPWEKKKDLVVTLFRQYSGGDRWELEALGLAAEGGEPVIYHTFTQNRDPLEWSQPVAQIVWRLHPEEAIPALKTRALAEFILSTDTRIQAMETLAFIPQKEAALAMHEISQSGRKDLSPLAQWWVENRRNNDWQPWATELPVKTDEALGADYQSPGVESLGVNLSENTNPSEEWTVEAVAGMKGDAARGKTLFVTHCQTCHRKEEAGNDIGPDLSQIHTKFDRAAMIDAIVNPGGSIAFGYEPTRIKTKSGVSYFGFLLSDGNVKMIKELSGERRTIRSEDIQEKEKINQSIMPVPAGLGLKPVDVADICVYLLSGK
ncbi:MAG: c-type cytochrome [Bacteroidia bacterium]|nr:c-type cytochrome [Bacteroidia bacterium]